MELSGLLMSVLLVSVLVFGFVVDGYAVFLRVAGVDGLGEILAMANLVQYIARISNVVVIFALSLAFETKKLLIEPSLIFLVASILGMFFVFVLIRSKRFCNLVTLVLRPVLYLSFRNASQKFVWRKVDTLREGALKLAAISALTNLLIVLAMFVPFGIASFYPEMRMTSVYVGQLINFFATLLVFAIQDPVSMRLVDGGVFNKVGSGLLYGRVMSYFLASILLLGLSLA